MFFCKLCWSVLIVSPFRVNVLLRLVLTIYCTFSTNIRRAMENRVLPAVRLKGSRTLKTTPTASSADIPNLQIQKFSPERFCFGFLQFKGSGVSQLCLTARGAAGPAEGGDTVRGHPPGQTDPKSLRPATDEDFFSVLWLFSCLSVCRSVCPRAAAEVLGEQKHKIQKKKTSSSSSSTAATSSSLLELFFLPSQSPLKNKPTRKNWLRWEPTNPAHCWVLWPIVKHDKGKLVQPMQMRPCPCWEKKEIHKKE